MGSSPQNNGKPNLEEIKKIAKATGDHALEQDVKKRIKNGKTIQKDGKAKN